MKKTSFFFLLFIFFNTLCFAENNTSIEKISLFIDKNNTNIESVKSKPFKDISSNHLNFGFNDKIVLWVKIEIFNKSQKKEKYILEIDNPLLEEIILYSPDNTFFKSGMLNITEDRTNINPSFFLNIDSNTKNIYYLKVENTTTSLQFSINLTNEENFIKSDKFKQFLIVLSVGMIVAFSAYALVLYIYTKDTSYLFYTLYIVILLFQQLTYVGFLPLYMPKEFTYIDNLLVVPKVGAVIITGILFARKFLKTKTYKYIDNIYKVLIFAVILQIIFLATPKFYYPEVTVLTGLIFIIFNYYAAIYVYKKGNKQARFFIVGWSFLLVGFFLSIIDALGIYSVMYHVPSLVLFCTVFEALFLLLAFVDKLNILQKEKNDVDKKLLEELHTRNTIIENQVTSRTKTLNNLYKELHHRVKNNLQIMLSIIRLQGEKFDEEILKEQFQKLENRIKSISKTHEILYLNDNIEEIDMYEYIYSLCEDISTSYDNNLIEYCINVDEKIPLRESVYVGIIINELVSNSIKHASSCNKIEIMLVKKDEHFYLKIADNGLGYKKENISNTSLGLRLVNSLVSDQLSGEIENNTIDKCEYIIRFKI